MLKKLLLTLVVASAFTFLVYFSLMDSLTRPSMTYLPMSNDTAISIIAKKNNFTSEQIDNVVSKYVYIKGNGKIYDSNVNTNSIGKYMGKTLSTVTTGNHFGWELYFPNINKTYFIDHLSGETISEK